jgi:hypothetical protein
MRAVPGREACAVEMATIGQAGVNAPVPGFQVFGFVDDTS